MLGKTPNHQHGVCRKMSFEANYEIGYPLSVDEEFHCEPSEDECQNCTFDCKYNPNPKYNSKL